MKVTSGQRMRYRFDNFMSKGIGSMMMGLAIVFFITFAFVVGIRAAIFWGYPEAQQQYFSGDDHADRHFGHHIYLAWLAITDPGNPAQDIQGSWLYKIPAITAGISGLILMSALVGLITTWLMDRMEQLRKGNSRVIENGHTLILGWEPQRVNEILRELIEANDSERNPCVCILAETPKEEMDDFLAQSLSAKARGNTRIVTRSGSISSIDNLQTASVETSKSVIVLATCNQTAPESERAHSDARVVKAILAVASCERPPAEDEDDELSIVAEIFNSIQRDIVIKTCPYPVTVVDAWDILAKIIVQTSRTAGLSVAYSELLSFEGCEMYFHNTKWGGAQFGPMQFHFPDGVPLGVRHADGKIHINPPLDYALKDDDDILIVADDDSTIKFKKKPVAIPSELKMVETRAQPQLERELIIGWNHMAPIIIEQYSDYVLDGSEITVLVENPDSKIQDQITQLGARHPNLSLKLEDGDPFDFNVLEGLLPPQKNNIIILNKSGDSADAEKNDSETIVILLMLRSIFDAANLDPSTQPTLIAEVADSRNQALVTRSGVKDFIISNRLVSMMLAQISEEADIKAVYDDLFEEDGSEIYVKPLKYYLNSFPVNLSFADCMSLAQQRGEVCMGVKIAADENNAEENFGVELIPNKKKTFEFGPEDCLVVVAEDET